MNFLGLGYGLTWAVLLVYGISLLTRTKKCARALKNGSD